MEEVVVKLSGSDKDIAAKVAVFPGWVLVRKVQTSGERKSSGGIVLPDHPDNFSKTSAGIVVKAGLYFEARSGSIHQETIKESGIAWPPPTGTVVEYTPNSEWQPAILKGSDYCVVKSIDLMLGVEAM